MYCKLIPAQAASPRLDKSKWRGLLAGQDQDQALSQFLQLVGDRHQKETTGFLQAPCGTDRRINAASALSRATTLAGGTDRADYAR
jgi:hypothetical protein